MITTGPAGRRSERNAAFRRPTANDPSAHGRIPPDACRADFPVLKKVLLDLGVPRTGMGFVEAGEVKSRLTSMGLKHARIAETLLAARLVGAMVCYEDDPAKHDTDYSNGGTLRTLAAREGEHDDRPYEVRLSALLVD